MDLLILSIADKEFTRAACIVGSRSLDQEDSRGGGGQCLPRHRGGLGPRPESFQQATSEAQWDPDGERPCRAWASQPLSGGRSRKSGLRRWLGSGGGCEAKLQFGL